VILELTPPHSGPPIDNDFGEGGFEDEGGFMDAGGFVPDEGGGGFMSDGDGGGGGGFISDGEEVRAHDDQVGSLDEFGGGGGEPRRIPLRTLPAILSSLNLPSDEDVLAVFRASASGWTEPDRRRDRNNEEQEEAMLMGGGVELKDFRAVCAALMGPDEGGEGEGEGDDQLSSGDDEDEDTYKVGDGDGGEDSSLSEITEDEYKDRESTTKPPASKKGKGRGRKKKLELEDNGRIKLNPRQREVVNDLWGMLKPEGEREVRGGHVLGRDEVRRKVRDLGEMWTEDEVSFSCSILSSLSLVLLPPPGATYLPFQPGVFCLEDRADIRLPRWLPFFQPNIKAEV
jgi:hypothetical protein